MRVGIVGGTGYTGAELLRLLSGRPDLQVAWATSARGAGTLLREHCPWLDSDLVLVSPEGELPPVEGVFLAQENGYAATVAGPWVSKGVKVVDLSADFRLRDPEAYVRGYGKPHPSPSPDFKVAYGLPEVEWRGEIGNADLVANPGCYVTASVLALSPLVNAGVVTGTPTIDGKSGHSGAGRSRATTEFLLSEGANDVRAYLPIGHRHTPEIEQGLGGLPVSFTPHMMPMPRGMFVTAKVPVSPCDPMAILKEAYAGEPFVRVIDRLPSSKLTLASNRCDLWAAYDERTGIATVLSTLDNLVKGASGQAIQNMNLMLGLEETAGLPRHGVWP